MVPPDPSHLPPPFDAAYYRARYPELAFQSDAAARAHYDAVGRAEGRVAAALAEREALVALIAHEASVLEIGPFCRPLLAGQNIEYLDMLDAAALRARALALGLDPAGCPPEIHHVGTLAQVGRRYAAIVASHSIEHQPDLIGHLAEIARVLEPGGRYYLIVPDKRWSFDHFLPESSIAEIIAAFHERRTVHPLARVIEHGALVTHNDPVRHWAGDHGDPAQDRTQRIRLAMERHAAVDGGYIDVHAWYFTPSSFAETIATLADLGLCALDTVAVYDTPRDRHEFCAVLQLRRPAGALHPPSNRAQPGQAARPHSLPRALPAPDPDFAMDIIFFQTADAFRYAPMLAVTAPTVTEYCRRHGFAYESFVGVKRGWWGWQASYNRIAQYAELIARGFTGWAIYLDADAYVVDLDFDLPAYLADKADRAAILATSGVTGLHWDINDGITFINLGHPEGRRLVELWAAGFAAIPDAVLREAELWLDEGNDQDLIQRVLREDAAMAAAVLIESMDFINSRHARFIRQHLRAQTAEIDARIRAIAAEVHAIFQQDRRVAAALLDRPALLDERGRAALRHPPGAAPRLVEMPAGRPQPALAQRIAAAWAATPERPVPPPSQAGFAALLDAGDADAVAAELARVGRAPLAQGFLGGARQHDRCATDPAFAYRRALRTHDALVSLAEAIGALAAESPDLGAWGENARRTPETLIGAIGDTLAIDLAPTATIGGWLGIAGGGSLVLHLRIVEAIHAAWRLRQLGELLGIGRVVEIGGGAGLTAHYARRLGIADYALIDTPVMQAVQAYALAAGDDMLLAGEPERPAALRLRPNGIAGAAGALLFNEDTLPEMAADAATALLAKAREAGAAAFLSVNQEATPAGQAPRVKVRDLASAAGWRLAQRQPHPLRVGFMEELFVTS